jgi:hypothetical protein
MMLLSDLHNNILKGSEHVGALHFLNEPALQQAISGIECYQTLYRHIYSAQLETAEVDEMDDETFFRIMKRATEVATENLPEAQGSTIEARLNIMLANMLRDEDFVAFDNIDHGLFQLH